MFNSLRSDVGRIVVVAAPLYLSMLVVSASALVNSAVLGRVDTAALAAFAVTAAVYSPATATVTGAVRGVMPFVSAVEGRRSETEEVPCSPPGW